MRDLAAVNQRRAVFADDQDVVGGEPAALENGDFFREHGLQWFHQLSQTCGNKKRRSQALISRR